MRGGSQSVAEGSVGVRSGAVELGGSGSTSYRLFNRRWYSSRSSCSVSVRKRSVEVGGGDDIVTGMRGDALITGRGGL